ncbi:MAG TPA: phosphodiester glycosidase family protein [Candidatus Limnocylindrales bacterium]|nr:phosphodiester glycosidase family protein [Candidatus Limnocylindrales bacterium]
MRLSIALGLMAVLLLALAPAATYGAITTPYQPSTTANLAPGVRYENGTLVAHSHTHHVNVVSVDMDRDELNVRLSAANGVATNVAFVTDQAGDYTTDEREVVATINGSTFFYLNAPDGAPIGGTGQGLNVSDGELINAGAPVAGTSQLLAFGVDGNDVPMIGSPTFGMDLSLPGNVQHAVHRINQRRNESEVVLYTPRYDSRTWTNDAGVEYVIEGFDLPLAVSGTHSGTVVAVNPDGNTPIDAGQVVLSVADGAAAPFASLAVGDVIELNLSIDPAWSNVVDSVGGRNPLVADGQDVTPKRGGYHPRSAVGIRADGSLVMLTADDGNVDSSGGMTLPEMASLMVSLGAVDAVNLDGGQSTQMAVRHPWQNEVSLVSGLQTPPGELRPVVNALQVVVEGAPGPDSDPPEVSSPDVSISAGKAGKQTASIGVAWSATDASTVSDTDVEMQVGSGSWNHVSIGSPAASAASILVPYGSGFRVRVRATDEWGNVSQWVESERLRLTLYDDGHAAVRRGGGWTRKSSSKAIGGAFRQSAATGAWMELAYQGLQVALISQVGPRKGPAHVSLNGQSPVTVPTTASAADVRRIVFVSPLAPASGARTIRATNAGTPATPLFDVDAFLVLRPAQ